MQTIEDAILEVEEFIREQAADLFTEESIALFEIRLRATDNASMISALLGMACSGAAEAFPGWRDVVRGAFESAPELKRAELNWALDALKETE